MSPWTRVAALVSCTAAALACGTTAAVTKPPAELPSACSGDGRCPSGCISDPDCPTPKVTNASAQKVIDFIRGLSGTRTIAGQHNREPSAEPVKWTNAIHDTTGRFPGLWSGDFLFHSFGERGTMLLEAKNQWNQGAVVSLLWHACPPTQAEPCGWEGGVLSHLSDEQWNELITEGTELNKTWLARVDVIAAHLKDLEDAGVAVLFRPHHEMNQGLFWWGGRRGPNGTRRLFQITHDYLVGTKKLGNIVWVWDVQDLSWDFAEFNPGDAYWDILAFDMYGNDGYTAQKYDAIVAASGGKPIAIGECERLPTAAELAAQPRWTFFMAWAELVYKGQSEQAIKDLYGAPNVVTLDEMPGWQ